MASSSTLLAPPSSLHHVFPSFHGADVRENFLSHVLKEFRSKGIDSFIDNDIERSKLIGIALVEAIRGSRIAIVMLSQNYASSTWCLNELVEIIKCREELGQTVMPIFYQVDPTHVKKQTSYFGKVFIKTCKGKTEEEIRRWKHALTQVAQIAGYHSTNGKTEAEMIEDIATDVSNKLNLSAPSSDFDGLVGMESHMTDLGPLLKLDSNEVRKIGIWGLPGIGKTTIARSLFNRHSQDFQLSVFIDNIKRNYARPVCSDDYSVKLNLQKHFMSQLTNETCLSIPHLGVVKDRLKDKKVLVVLDDVDHLEQLEALAKETSWFGPGSRIIVTTQDQRVLKASGIDHIHEVNLPRDDEALQIFCINAFDQKYPKDGFEELACAVINLVGRLPLGLKVMGSYFWGMSKQDWTEALPRLNAHLDRDGEIASILKFSYDALKGEDKSLFLHIACFFFQIEAVDIVESCLEDCFLDVTQGLRVLSQKSLISFVFGRIYMHNLLIQLGRKIVREESVSEPGKRQFLNEGIDVAEVINDDNAGNSSVIGIHFAHNGEFSWRTKRAERYYFLSVPRIFITKRGFERFPNLQFLDIVSIGVKPQSMNYVSQKLKVLKWLSFEMTCFPSSFNTEFLVKLEMMNSKLEKLWKKYKPLRNLKWMDMSYSKRLKELPDLSTATNLYYLNLSDCSRLVKLPSSIGNAINLQTLNLSYCSSLVELPSSMRKLGRLLELDLKYCSKLEVVLANINLESLKVLDMSGCSLLKSYSTDIQEPDPCIGRISRLFRLVPREMKKLVSLPPLPDSLGEYISDCTDIQEIERMSSLRRLYIKGMKKLTSLPQLPDSIWELDAEDCESLERLDCSFPNPDIRLNFRNCFKLNQEARDLISLTPTNKYAVFPGREVPMCFTYRSSGSSVTVKLEQKPPGKSTKFKACIILEGEGEWEHHGASVCCSITSGGNALTSSNKELQRIFPRHLYTFEVEVETEDVTSTEFLFDFELLDSDSVSKTSEIKECGILQLL